MNSSMNDRFKFRAWNKLARKYIPDIQDRDLVQGGDIDDDKFFDDYLYDDAYVIEQCTGLTDKNGRLIYEGDILGGVYENLYIHYCDKCRQFQLKAKDHGCMACEGDIHWYELVEAEDKKELEVIGNIHENEELLKGASI